MSRYPKTLFGPAGACDACGRFCQGLHQVGATCYHSACGKGTFRHRSYWTFLPCPNCADSGSEGCGHCHWKGIVARPRPDAPPGV